MNCFTKSKSVEIVTKSWLNIKQIITEDGNAIVMSCDPKNTWKLCDQMKMFHSHMYPSLH